MQQFEGCKFSYSIA